MIVETDLLCLRFVLFEKSLIWQLLLDHQYWVLNCLHLDHLSVSSVSMLVRASVIRRRIHVDSDSQTSGTDL